MFECCLSFSVGVWVKWTGFSRFLPAFCAVCIGVLAIGLQGPNGARPYSLCFIP